MTRRLNRYPRDPIAFIDDLVKKNELGQPFRMANHQRAESCKADLHPGPRPSLETMIYWDAWEVGPGGAAQPCCTIGPGRSVQAVDP